MYVFVHVCLGALIGILTGNYIATAALSFLSHFVLDSILHWQYFFASKSYQKGAVYSVLSDLFISLVMIFLIAKITDPSLHRLIIVGAAFSALPDLDDVIFFFLPKDKRNRIISAMQRYQDWHVRIQKETHSLKGVFTQLAIVIVCFAVMRIAQ